MGSDHRNTGWAENHSLPRQYAESLLVIEEGSGVRLKDVTGKEYLDFASGIAVNSLGYGRTDVSRLLGEQAARLIHISNLFTTPQALALADRLVRSSPRPADQPWSADKDPGYFAAVHFGNSGTEANEAALKYARAYHSRKGRSRPEIIAFENSFHGRSMGALSVTATEKYRKPFGPLVPGVKFCRYNDSRMLRRLADRKTGAIIVEVVQGEGGIVAMSPEFAASLNELAAARDIILIADEVQTGLGRTGSLYASEAVGLEPDILTLAKPLAAGLPLSATLIRQKINDQLHAGDHASTFGGGPLTTAVASLVWDEINAEGYMADVARRAALLEETLRRLQQDFPGLFLPGEPRGRGMLRGLQVRDGSLLPALLDRLREGGLLLLRAGADVLRFAPPLVITERDIQEMDSIIRTELGGSL